MEFLCAGSRSIGNGMKEGKLSANCGGFLRVCAFPHLESEMWGIRSDGEFTSPRCGPPGFQLPSFTAMDRGRMIRAIASSTTQLAAATSSSHRLTGVCDPPKGISVATKTAFPRLAGS
jgi:hypothetical protein